MLLGALRDDTKNGWVADYGVLGVYVFWFYEKLVIIIEKLVTIIIVVVVVVVVVVNVVDDDTYYWVYLSSDHPFQFRVDRLQIIVVTKKYIYI